MPRPVHALLLLTPSCPHCPRILSALADLLKEGLISRLEAVDITQEPQVAEAVGTRSVPWMRIGQLELVGAHSTAEIRRWVEAAAGSDDGARVYLQELLDRGGLDRAQAWLERHPEHLSEVLDLLADLEAPMAVRIGASALLEHLAGDPRLTALLPQLLALTTAGPPQTRADAAHILSLLPGEMARPHLERLRRDPDPEVREIATEALDLTP